jgi:hypothetical protein
MPIANPQARTAASQSPVNQAEIDALKTRVDAIEASSGTSEAIDTLKKITDQLTANETIDDATVATLKAVVDAIVIPDLSSYAKKTDIPAIPIFPVYDLSIYAKITDLPEVPALPDLTPYAEKTELNTLGDLVASESGTRHDADTALEDRIHVVETRIIDPDTTTWTHSGGNTELKIIIPDRFGAYPDTLSFRLYDRRTSSNPSRFKDISVPFSVFNPTGGSGWTPWLDTAYPVAIWQDVTFPDGAVMRIHLHHFVTPQGTISLDFIDSHANANNVYGAVGSIRVAYARKVATNVVSVPMGTTVRKVCTIIANNGDLTVNGLANDILYTGTSGRIKVEVPLGQEILSVTAPSGITVSIADPVAGALEVAIAGTFTSATVNLLVIFRQAEARSIYAVANAGTWVSFKTLQWCVPAAGNRSLQVRSVSGSVNLRWINFLAWDGTATPTSATITASSTQYLKSDWNFGGAGNNQHAIVEDLTNNKRYKVLMMINGSYNNNVFIVEDIT